jgi:Luciferase-like monooxygenase
MRFGTYYFLQAPSSIAHPDVVRREVEQTVRTEELGFDSIWLTEHGPPRNAHAQLAAPRTGRSARP